MRKSIIISCLLGCLFFTLLTANIYGAIVQFMLVGVIPGTNSSLSPGAMLALYAITALGIALATSRFNPKTAFSDRLPKRRYHRG